MDNNICQISIYIKPTNHSQICHRCGKDIEKSNKIVRILRGEYGGCALYNHYHINCFVRCIIHTLKDSISGDEMQKIIDELVVDNI
jgi:hypothetical protein